jgi:hypothetical protein
MLRDEALQGNLYAKSWDEVFLPVNTCTAECVPHQDAHSEECIKAKPCQHDWGEYTMKDVPALEARWHRKYRFTPGSPMRGCHNMVCTKCGEYQFIDSSD